VTAFPWTTLITGVSTLAGALGAVGLKGRFDFRDQQRQTREAAEAAQADRRREACTSLLVGARQLLANLQQMRNYYSTDMNDPTVPALNARMDSRSDQVSLAAASVDLLGSDGVRAAERELADAAQVFTIFRVVADGQEWSLTTPSGYDEEHIQAAQQRLQMAIDAFADAARAEVNAPGAALPSQTPLARPVLTVEELT
jgi:hypothetical protein